MEPTNTLIAAIELRKIMMMMMLMTKFLLYDYSTKDWKLFVSPERFPGEHVVKLIIYVTTVWCDVMQCGIISQLSFLV